jgi:hypothetical protein
MAGFKEFVSKAPPAMPRLPLFHKCESYDFRSIAEQNELKTSNCKNFENKPLFFFFYGKPAYRTSGDGKSTSDLSVMPVVIGIKPNVKIDIARVAPFDTGAYKMYRNFINPKMKCEDFLVTPDEDSPGRLVTLFFGSNERYYSEEPVANLNIPPLEFEVASYLRLITYDSESDFDSRRSTIEVQSKSPLALDASTVLLVVVPGAFLDEANFRDKLTKLWKAKVLHYEIHRGNPNDYTSEINRLVKEYLLSEQKYF